MKIVETTRLTLRELVVTDAPFMLQLMNEPAYHTPDNARSIALLRKLGLHFESPIVWPDDSAELHLYSMDHQLV